MNHPIEIFCGRLEVTLADVENRLHHTRDHLNRAAACPVDDLDRELNKSRSALESTRKQSQEAGNRVQQFLSEKAKEVVNRYEDWKTDREIRKLEEHADRLESHAVDAVQVAAAAVHEAEIAIMEALKARKIAVDVAG